MINLLKKDQPFLMKTKKKRKLFVTGNDILINITLGSI